jgi:hypothetical protein
VCRRKIKFSSLSLSSAKAKSLAAREIKTGLSFDKFSAQDRRSRDSYEMGHPYGDARAEGALSKENVSQKLKDLKEQPGKKARKIGTRIRADHMPICQARCVRNIFLVPHLGRGLCAPFP